MTIEMNEIIYLKFEGTKLYFDFNDDRFNYFRKETVSLNNKNSSRGTGNFWGAVIDDYHNKGKIERTFLNKNVDYSSGLEAMIIFDKNEIKKGQVIQVRSDVASSRKYTDRVELFFVFVVNKENEVGIRFFDTLFKAVRYARKEFNSEV